MTSNPLTALVDAGQSPWCDNVSRGTMGVLAAWVNEGEITGVTSNPTIFEKAINESRDYDADLEALARAGMSAEQIFEALATEDIRAAADLLRPVYDRTGFRDGYVSLEVDPKLAHEAERTLGEVRRLFQALDRPNVMIKVPGTAAGISAFEQATADGINVNVTLLFSIDNYVAVARAYVRGLEKRLASGQPVDHVASVASFFVSRVDSAVDKAIEEHSRGGSTDLSGCPGRAAIANARIAYQRYGEIFSGEGWSRLATHGAQTQRPLWASTSTKNPAYRDVMYVEQLIGPDTVNTMPPATIAAFRDHGTVALTLQQGVEEAEALFGRLSGAGINLDAITDQLQHDGVRLFAESFEKLLEVTEAKRRDLAGQPVA